MVRIGRTERRSAHRTEAPPPKPLTLDQTQKIKRQLRDALKHIGQKIKDKPNSKWLIARTRNGDIVHVKKNFGTWLKVVFKKLSLTNLTGRQEGDDIVVLFQKYAPYTYNTQDTSDESQKAVMAAEQNQVDLFAVFQTYISKTTGNTSIGFKYNDLMNFASNHFASDKVYESFTEVQGNGAYVASDWTNRLKSNDIDHKLETLQELTEKNYFDDDDLNTSLILVTELNELGLSDEQSIRLKNYTNSIADLLDPSDTGKLDPSTQSLIDEVLSDVSSDDE